MQTRLPQTEDNGPWSDESTTEIMFDITSEESLCTDPSEILTLEAVESSKDHLDDALELNRQLHASLQRKQEEISALKEKNAQLKELAKQAEQYATILDVLIPQPVNGCVSRPSSSTEPSEWHFTASEGSWLPSVLINTEQQACSQTHRVKRQLWPTDHDGYSNSSDHEVYSRGSDHEVYSRSSGHDSYSRGSGQEPYFRSCDYDPYSKSSDPKPFSKSSCHESYSKSSDDQVCLGNSDHELYSQSSGHDSYSRSSDHEPYSKTADHDLYSQSYDHEVYSNSANCSAGENSANSFVGGNPDPKRLKLDHDHFQLDYKDLTSQTEQVHLESTEDSPSNETNHCTQSLNTEMIQVYGAFHGLKVVMARHSMTSDLSECGEEELVCFKTSIREHSTVRTNVFPHGKTFTSRTPDGSCRFLWVPNQN